MKKLIVYLIVLLLITMSLLVAGEKPNLEQEKSAIQQLINSAYRDGLCNVGDVDAIKEGFHPGFNLVGMTKDQDDIWKLPIYSWMTGTAKKKAAGKYPPKEKITFQYPLIDITGNAAVVKVEFYKGEQKAYTDYLSLYKFKTGWQIISKIYFEHPAPEAEK